MTRIVGRYAICDEIAAGGMATLHLGRLLGPVGFSRTVAIKRLHPQYARDPAFASSMLDEARLVSRVKHLNVVPILDVISTGSELLLVMDYVHGESLAMLMREASERPPVAVVLAILAGALHGLHAAHVARDEQGMPLGLVHRDVSPQNIMVGTDGLSRILDFGIAKAHGRTQTTEDGQLKGKLGYMAPEQFSSADIDRRVDVYAASVVLWECLTGRRLLDAPSPAMLMNQILSREHPPPGAIVEGIPPELDALVLRGLARHREQRFSTAREMAIALESVMPLPLPHVIGDWVEAVAARSLAEKVELVADVEAETAALWSDTDGRVRIDEDAIPTHVDTPGRDWEESEGTGRGEPEAVIRPERRIDAGDATVSGIHTGLPDVESATHPVPAAPPDAAAPQADEPRTEPWSAPRLAPREAPAEPARWPLPVAAVGAVALAVLAGIWFVTRINEGAPAHLSADMPSAVSSSVPATSEEATPVASSAPVESASQAAPVASPVPSRATASPVPCARPPIASKPPPVTDTCKPPYVVDADGIRRPKLHCLGRR